MWFFCLFDPPYCPPSLPFRFSQYNVGFWQFLVCKEDNRIEMPQEVPGILRKSKPSQYKLYIIQPWTSDKLLLNYVIHIDFKSMDELFHLK